METQADAKNFFVERITQQALAEGSELTRAELYMLRWSESDPDFRRDASLDARFAQETSEGEFESKIAGLVRRAHDNDCASDPSAKHAFESASALLSEGDHYLLVMIEEAFHRKRKLWWWPF